MLSPVQVSVLPLTVYLRCVLGPDEELVRVLVHVDVLTLGVDGL